MSGYESALTGSPWDDAFAIGSFNSARTGQIVFGVGGDVTSKWNDANTIYYHLTKSVFGPETTAQVSDLGASGAYWDDLYVTTINTNDVLVSSTGELTIPYGANPTTNAVGEVAIDSDDGFVEFYDGTASRILPALKSISKRIPEPDLAQAVLDDQFIFHFMADAYPHGVTIKDIAISASAAITDSWDVEEWDDRAGTTQSLIERISMTSTQYQEDDGTLSDASIAADAFIILNMDDTPDNVGSLEITITFYINQGD
jgi:hypothetical protein